MSQGYSLNFYRFLVFLHATGAIVATVIGFICDTGKARQGALIPYYVAWSNFTLPSGAVNTQTILRKDLQFKAAFPWAEDGILSGNDWNPFALIFVFEWLTAAFALRPLARGENRGRLFVVWLIWLAIGLAVFISWTATNSGGPCVLMLVTVSLSFVACAIVGYAAVGTQFRLSWLYSPLTQAAPSDLEQVADTAGRVWSIPSKVSGLRARKQQLADADDKLITPQTEEELRSDESVGGVLLRYAEYCVTAPLLFLAVVCLMVPDPPAWLFVMGYWSVLLCNAFGVALHASFCAKTLYPSGEQRGMRTLLSVLADLFSFPW